MAAPLQQHHWNDIETSTRHWTLIDGSPRFNDYIERLKPNGYQSLHYTATTEFQSQAWTLEIQIRTGEMHKVAEFGLALHWDYEGKNKPTSEKAAYYSSDSCLRSVQEWHWQHQPSSGMRWSAEPGSEESESFVDNLHRELRAERIEKRTQRLAPYLEALNIAHRIWLAITCSCSLPSGACVFDA
jgi:(p)ppGpp synthase/HD superfamily hydrolase